MGVRESSFILMELSPVVMILDYLYVSFKTV